MRRLPQDQPNTKIHRERDLRVLSRLALLLFCGVVLAAGFVFAAKQHFAAVQYGYNSEALRKQHEQLVREQQQLFLKKEQASAPARLERAARALGLKPLRPGQIGTPGLPQTSQAPSQLATAVAGVRTSASIRR